MKMKVKCTGYKAEERYFTLGKIYTWKNNHLTADNGFTFYYTVEGTNPDKWGLSKWYSFEVVEETKTDKKIVKASELHIGDRVQVVDYVDGHNMKGMIGTVVDSCFGIAFDEKFGIGHTCSGKCEEGHGRFATSYDEFILLSSHNDSNNKRKIKIVDITIKTDGKKTTTAIKTVNGVEVARGVANCCPDDDYDMAYGINLAIERMKENEPKPEEEVNETNYVPEIGQGVYLIEGNGYSSSIDTLWYIVDIINHDFAEPDIFAIPIDDKHINMFESYLKNGAIHHNNCLFISCCIDKKRSAKVSKK